MLESFNVFVSINVTFVAKHDTYMVKRCYYRIFYVTWINEYLLIFDDFCREMFNQFNLFINYEKLY